MNCEKAVYRRRGCGTITLKDGYDINNIESCGAITLKNECDINDVAQIANDAMKELNDYFNSLSWNMFAKVYVLNGNLHLSCNGKWQPDLIRKILDAIAPYAATGSWIFKDENEKRWRYLFMDGEWHKQYAHILYDWTDNTGCIRSELSEKGNMLTGIPPINIDELTALNNYY